MSNLFKYLVSRIARIGANVKDDEEIRLQKSLLAICSIPFAIAGAVWGFMYILFGETLAALIPLSYSLFSGISVVYFALTRQFAVFRFSQLLLILILPFALMISLGGFINGSAVILWGLLSPLGALLFDKPQRAAYWFVAYLSLVVLSGFLQPLLALENHLSAGQKALFFVINIIGVGSLIYMMVYYFAREKNFFQERSEALLLNILPKEIADILRSETRTIANHFNSASILFADVVDFTHMSSGMAPTAIVELLNEVFSTFDTLADRYGLEKIKTIGDCYMVAAGVPRPRTDHAEAITNMALAMRDYIASHEFAGKHLQLRYGINSGPVVAGVIGRKKFIYDLWGDSVNVASRMESHGAKNAIQITENTYSLIRDQFNCEYRGTVPVKGKTEMKVWHVLSHKQAIP